VKEERKKADEITAQVASLSKSLDVAKAEVVRLKRLVSIEHKDAVLRQKEVATLKSSEANRVGMFVTWPARKAWGGVKCLRENGVKYTVKHAAGKVLRLFGSTCKW
jgi:hypothetical protein